MVRNKSLRSVSISDIKVGYKASLWGYMTKLSYMNKLGDILPSLFLKNKKRVRNFLFKMRGNKEFSPLSLRKQYIYNLKPWN